jgi:glycosyltransferase involved in cell wall biosynthesis
MHKLKKIGIDITGLAHSGKFTGVERVDTEFHKHLAQFVDSNEYELVPIYTVAGDLNLVELLPKIALDEIVSKPLSDISECELIFLGFLNASISVKRILDLKKEKNLKVISLIHDIMPIKNPEWFLTPKTSIESKFQHQSKNLFQLYLQMTLSVADILIVTSHQVKSDIEKLGWRHSAQIEVVHLGAFTKDSVEIPHKKLDQLNCVYLSTVEPRKAHIELIEAFQILWAKGIDITLNIVGNIGWLVDDLIDLILKHPEFGKRLLWHKGLSDEEVKEVYNVSQIAFAVSYDEGFGLNIEEALVQGLKVIARDIPVFRERNYDNLYFYEGGALELSLRIMEVLKLPTNHATWKEVRTMEDFTVEVIQLLEMVS